MHELSVVKRLFSLSLLALGLASGILGAEACKNHADPARQTAMICERVYRICPNVVPANPAEAEVCASEFRGPCGAELRQYVQCSLGKCDDAGAIDRLEIERVCLATLEAYRKCDDEFGADGGDAGREGGDDQGQLPPFIVDSGPGDAGITDGAIRD